jgi:predicted CoA-binding protein
MEPNRMIDPATTSDFLAQHRIALIGASANPKSFAATIYCALRENGYDVVAVGRGVDTFAGDACYGELADVPGDIDGAIVMVRKEAAEQAVKQCVSRGVRRVWLFKGLGGPGAVSDEAVRLCRDAGVEVIPGACPLMFLEPVRGFHRFHRALRRLNGSLDRAS